MKINEHLRKYFIFFFIAVNCYAVEQQSLSFTIKTANIDSTFQKLVSLTEEKGGFFTNFSNSFLTLRFPAEHLQEFQAYINSVAQIEGKSFENLDRSADVERINAQIESRKKLLETYFNLVKNATFSELQSVEREMVTLNAQIDALQGQLEGIKKRSELVSIQIYAQDLPRIVPVVDNHSPFEWINKTNLNYLKWDF